MKDLMTHNCTLYLLRHGDSRPDFVKRYIGQVDIPLNETGRKQARAWQTYFKQIDFSAAYCSDLKRCCQTAQIVLQDHSLNVHPREDLREISLGQWENQPVATIRQKYPQEYAERGLDLALFRPPEGESFADLRSRTIPVIESLVRQHTGKVLIVTHAGVIRVLLCYILEMKLKNIFSLGQNYAGLTILDWREEKIIIKAMNCTHVEAGL